jgi:hypothetical protein
VRKLGILACLASAACEDLPPDRTFETAEVRLAFEGWTRTIQKGDAPAVFAGMSLAFRSQWLFDLLKGGEARAHAWRRSLTGEARTGVDLWYNFHKDKDVPRVPTLDGALLNSPAVVAVWRDIFAESADEMKRQMSKLQISEVYQDGGGVTVLVKNVVGETEMYEMVAEGGGWKINHHRRALRSVEPR